MPPLFPQLPGKVRCANCGLLSLRVVGGAIIEVDEQFRKHAASLAGRFTETALSDGYPFCLERYANLPLEILQQADYGTDPPASTELSVLKTITAERECDGYGEWRPGATPKEHRELFDRNRMLK